MNDYVYILSNDTDVAIYTGVTNDLQRRVYEHKNHLEPNSFTAKYNIHKLVYFEETSSIRAAIERKKQIKSWNRKRKNQLVEKIQNGKICTSRYFPGRTDCHVVASLLLAMTAQEVQP